ncbi:MAG: 16S rRNA (cytidine(1402)-2'-O)-methyltransferase [Pseudomonadota bacterium]
MTNRGKLYIVATPIGNLGDMTFRAVEILKNVDTILAEDTRHCARLLSHYQISTKAWSMHNFNEAAQAEKILEHLLNGQSFAVISDAGTPLISDPGWAMVKMARDAGIDVIAIPGACALIAALSIAGLPTQQFHFFGFLPVKSSARQTILKQVSNYEGTLAFYESPHRLIEMLEDCQQVFGNERVCCIVKELTKIFETVRVGPAAELLRWLNEKPEHLKGEFVVLIAPSNSFEKDMAEAAAKTLLKTLLQHLPLKTAVKVVSEHYALNKNALYDFGLKVK